MVSIADLQSTTITLPVVGAISIAGLVIAGAIIFFLARRKKTVTLEI